MYNFVRNILFCMTIIIEHKNLGQAREEFNRPHSGNVLRIEAWEFGQVARS